eukprot:7343273-Pyramimonas_sp.AAC.1
MVQPRPHPSLTLEHWRAHTWRPYNLGYAASLTLEASSWPMLATRKSVPTGMAAGAGGRTEGDGGSRLVYCRCGCCTSRGCKTGRAGSASRSKCPGHCGLRGPPGATDNAPHAHPGETPSPGGWCALRRVGWLGTNRGTCWNMVPTCWLDTC